MASLDKGRPSEDDPMGDEDVAQDEGDTRGPVGSLPFVELPSLSPSALREYKLYTAGTFRTHCVKFESLKDF